MTKLPRRSALAMMAATPAALSLSGMPLGAAQDPEAALRQSLARMRLPMAPVRLDLVQFDSEARAGRTRMSAVVRMTWAPGMRQRKFEVTARTPDDALEYLVQHVQTSFAKAGQA